jgi:hypothetical protein
MYDAQAVSVMIHLGMELDRTGLAPDADGYLIIH